MQVSSDCDVRIDDVIISVEPWYLRRTGNSLLPWDISYLSHYPTILIEQWTLINVTTGKVNTLPNLNTSLGHKVEGKGYSNSIQTPEHFNHCVIQTKF